MLVCDSESQQTGFLSLSLSASLSSPAPPAVERWCRTAPAAAPQPPAGPAGGCPTEPTHTHTHITHTPVSVMMNRESLETDLISSVTLCLSHDDRQRFLRARSGAVTCLKARMMRQWGGGAIVCSFLLLQ